MYVCQPCYVCILCIGDVPTVGSCSLQHDYSWRVRCSFRRFVLRHFMVTYMHCLSQKCARFDECIMFICLQIMCAKYYELRCTFLPIACRLSVCDVGGSAWKSWKLIARTISPTPSLLKGHPPTPRGTWGNLGETRGGLGKSGVLEHKSGNISETHKDRGKVK